MRYAVASVLCLLGVGIACYAFAAACKNVDIKVNNQGSRKIKVLKIEYRSVEENRWRTEDFNNKEAPARKTTTVATNQNLQYIEGHRMKSIKLHYRVWCNGKWSTSKTYTDSSFDSPRCSSNTNKAYRIDLPASAVGC